MNRLKIVATHILTTLFFGISHHYAKKSSTSTRKFTTNHFEYGSYNIPHKDKKWKGGEDAYYANDNVLCVADGVGGWNDQGIDPAKYSRELVNNIEKYYNANEEEYIKNPKNLLINAAKDTKSVGSSTCCILTLDKKDGILRASYIGDSGYILLNSSCNIKEISKENTRSFNFPYQIGTNSDNPEMSLEFQYKINDNDLLVVGTDGLFDNLDENQIAETLKNVLQNKSINSNLLDKAAKKLSERAYNLSLKSDYFSPFAKRAKHYGYDIIGGKEDDITVIVAQLKLNNTNSTIVTSEF